MGMKEDLQQDSVEELRLRDGIAIDRHTVARAAVAMMRDHELGCAVVVNNNVEPTGIFTERALVNLLMSDASLDEVSIERFAESDYVTVSLTDPVSRVWSAVHDGGHRFVCVTDAEGKLIGLTGQRGLAEYVADRFPQRLIVQRLGSKPWMSQREGA